MTDPRSTPSIPVAPEERPFCVDCGHWDHAPGGCDGLGHIFTEEWVPVVTDCTCEVHDDEREARPTPVEPEARPERASLTLNPEFGAALWLGDRLVARIAAGLKGSRITPDDPTPQWRKDAMTFVNAVNRLAVEPDGLPLDVDVLAEIIREVDGDHSLGAGALAEAIVARLASTPSEANER